MYSTTIQSSLSGHTLFVQQIAREELPAAVQANSHSAAYTTFYAVKNWDKGGVVFFYLAKGAEGAKNEIVAFYNKGGFWASFGKTFKSAIEGAQKDAWMYA